MARPKGFDTPHPVSLILEEEHFRYIVAQATEASRRCGKIIPVTTFIRQHLEETIPYPKQLKMKTAKKNKK